MRNFVENIHLYKVYGRYCYYLHCRKKQIVSYLYTRGVPVELLFYNTYENTSQIEHGFMEQNELTYTYNTQTVNSNDLALIGVNERVEIFEKLVHAEPLTRNLINENKMIFIQPNDYYIPFRKNYQTRHGFHSLMVWGYDYTNEVKKIFLLDLDDTDYFCGEIDSIELHKAFNDAPIEKRAVVYFEIVDNMNVNDTRKIISDKFIEYFKDFCDDFSFYDNIHLYVKNHMDQPEENEILPSLSHALFMLSGSRFLLSKFIESIINDKLLSIHLLTLSNEIIILRNIIIKAYYSGNFDLHKIKYESLLLKKKEIALLEQIKQCAASLKSFHHD